MAVKKDTNDKLQVGINYPAFQMAKALETAQVHEDPAVRRRAESKIAKWLNVIKGILSGSATIGSRKPIHGVPVWATPEVVTGGFVTGALLAGGPVKPHEQQWLADIPVAAEETETRRLLNSYFLSEPGLASLRELLRTQRYDVGVPEEGALLAIAWLVEHGHADVARHVLDAIAGQLANLRFYPIRTEAPVRSGDRVHLENVSSVVQRLNNIKPHPRILAQKKAVEALLPLLDRAVTLFLETVAGEPPHVQTQDGKPAPPTNGKLVVEGGWPCQSYPDGWTLRAKAWLYDFDQAQRANSIAKGSRLAELHAFMERAVADPRSLNGRDVGKIRLILAGFVAKRGVPGSPQCNEKRARQQADVKKPMFSDVAHAVMPRLAALPQDDGIMDMNAILLPLTTQEAGAARIAPGTTIPATIQRKLERCRVDSIEALVERNVITSGETLARVLPQMTSNLKAAAFADDTLRYLYAAIYRAFRRRRSLLLLNLQSQVKIEELPWIAALEPLRQNDASTKEAGRHCLGEIVALTLRAFPQAIVPNKLLQELRALIKEAGLEMPLVDELAADIFIGQFTDKFVATAKSAAALLEGSLYERYYAIEWSEVRDLPEADPEQSKKARRWSSADRLLRICENRAGVNYGGYRPAENGMILEQEQILTTQNLAVLFEGLSLAPVLKDQLMTMAQHAFRWICQRQQDKATKWHAKLIMVKNTAYAWRQMIFYLSMCPPRQAREFLPFAREHLDKQSAEFRQRFLPVLRGLEQAFDGVLQDDESTHRAGARRFLGWSKDRHWLLV